MRRRLKLTLRREERHSFSGASTSYRLLNGNGYEIARFCSDQFHAATGFRLKPGEEKRIEIVIKEL